MKYIAKKVKKEFEVSGLKEMETIEGTKVEVIIGKKMYKQDQLKGIIENLEEEIKGMNEKYYNDIEDLTAIYNAIEKVK